MFGSSLPPAAANEGSAPRRRGRGVKHKKGFRHALREILSWKTLLVLGAILLWAYNFQWVERQVPFLVTAQLKMHQILSNLDPHRKRVEKVTLVQIDDDSFYSPPLSGTLPTNRAFLGDLGLAAAKHGALVVAFDIDLGGPSGQGDGENIRKSDNEHLLDAIRKIERSGKPVVLAIGLKPYDKGDWLREPSIFRDDQLPEPGTRMGYINLPKDPRQIPLVSTAWGADGNAAASLESFSLAIVDSYERARHVRADDQTEHDPAVAKAIADGEFVYGGFLPNEKWDLVTAKQLLRGEHQADKCFDRVVIIGSTWHDDWGRGGIVDEHSSPIGPVPGLYLHGNYVEALLRDDFRPAVPEKVAAVVDLGIAVLFYVLFRSAKKRVAEVGVLLTFVFLFVSAYLMFANVGIYFDFIAPVSLVFVHLLVEAL
jgi:CHASE2 domain-containing sensor protein